MCNFVLLKLIYVMQKIVIKTIAIVLHPKVSFIDNILTIMFVNNDTGLVILMQWFQNWGARPHRRAQGGGAPME